MKHFLLVLSLTAGLVIPATAQAAETSRRPADGFIIMSVHTVR